MNSDRFKIFLRNLGFSEEVISEKFSNSTFTYTINADQNKFDINYVYTPTNEEIFQTHLYYWNRNNVNVFIAVSNDKTYLINAKEKPNLHNIVRLESLRKFIGPGRTPKISIGLKRPFAGKFLGVLILRALETSNSSKEKFVVSCRQSINILNDIEIRLPDLAV